MKLNWKSIQKDLKVNKEGIVIGGIIGYMVAQFLKTNTILVNAAMQTQGLLDSFLGEVNVATGVAKLTIILVMTFAFLGYLVDKAIYPNK